MTVKETIKAVLTAYGFDDISIDIEKPSVYDYTYIVSASSTRNPEQDIYVIGYGLMSTLYDIFSYVKENNISPSLDFLDCTAKDVINDITRKHIIEHKLEQERKVKQLADSQKWIVELVEQYNPCKQCKLNTHEYWDDMHYNCEKNHTMACEYLRKHLDSYSKLLKYNKDKEKNKNAINECIEIIKDNYKNTSI